MDHITICTLPASSVLLKVRTDSPRRLAALSFSFRTLTRRVLSTVFSFLTAFRSLRGESLLLTLSSARLLESREGLFSQLLVMGPRALVSLGCATSTPWGFSSFTFFGFFGGGRSAGFGFGFGAISLPAAKTAFAVARCVASLCSYSKTTRWASSHVNGPLRTDSPFHNLLSLRISFCRCGGIFLK